MPMARRTISRSVKPSPRHSNDRARPSPEFSSLNHRSWLNIVLGEKITNKGHAAKLLERVMKAHSHILVTIPGMRDKFSTSILEINPAENYILLDQIIPWTGHSAFLEGGELKAKTVLQGVEISFSVLLEKHIQESGFTVYQVSFPGYVLYMQKRQNFRTNLGLGTSIPIYIRRDDGTPIRGKIVNISETGAGIVLDAPYNLENSEILPRCEIRINEDEIIDCKFEVRFTHKKDMSTPQRVGGKFLSLSGMHKRTLAKLVADLQRDMMKRIPKDQV